YAPPPRQATETGCPARTPGSAAPPPAPRGGPRDAWPRHRRRPPGGLSPDGVRPWAWAAPASALPQAARDALARLSRPRLRPRGAAPRWHRGWPQRHPVGEELARPLARALARRGCHSARRAAVSPGVWPPAGPTPPENTCGSPTPPLPRPLAAARYDT